MKVRDERMKASDVFRKTDYVFRKKISFDEAFPEIDDIRVEVEERGEGVRQFFPGDSKSIYGKSLLGEYVDCSNSLCYNGGVSIGEAIREMVRSRATERETSQICCGYEGSPKGRRKYRKCTNHFKVKVAIKFKEGEPPAA